MGWRYYWGILFRELKPKQTGLSDWFELPAYLRNSDKLKTTILVIAAAMTFVLPAFGHYFWVAKPPYDPHAMHFIYACAGLAMIPLGYLLHYLLILSCVREAKILTQSDRFALGDEILLRFQQRFAGRRLAERVALELVCEKRTLPAGKRRKCSEEVENLHHKQFEVVNGPPGISDAAIDIERKRIIPPELQPSSDPHGKLLEDVPRYYWYFRVRVPIALWVVYKAKFPIQVQRVAVT